MQAFIYGKFCWATAQPTGLGRIGGQSVFVVLGGDGLGAFRPGVGVQGGFGLGDYAAVAAHVDAVDDRFVLEHPVVVGQFGGDAVDRGLGAEGLVAADAEAGFFLFDQDGAAGGLGEV